MGYGMVWHCTHLHIHKSERARDAKVLSENSFIVSIKLRYVAERENVLLFSSYRCLAVCWGKGKRERVYATEWIYLKGEGGENENEREKKRKAFLTLPKCSTRRKGYLSRHDDSFYSHSGLHQTRDILSITQGERECVLTGSFSIQIQSHC